MHGVYSVPRSPTMSRLFWAVALLGAFQFTLSKSIRLGKRWEGSKVKHEWIEVPKGWVEVGQPPGDYLLEMGIGLKQGRFDELLEHLDQVSHPDHHRHVFMYAFSAQCFLTPPERVDMENIYRKRRLTNSLLRVPRPLKPSKLG